MDIRLVKIIDVLVSIVFTLLLKYLFTGSIYVSGLYIITNLSIGVIFILFKFGIIRYLTPYLTSFLEKRGLNVSIKEVLFYRSSLKVGNKENLVSRSCLKMDNKALIIYENKVIILYKKEKMDLISYQRGGSNKSPFLDISKKLSKKRNNDLNN